jgi:hypothetical protein
MVELPTQNAEPSIKWRRVLDTPKHHSSVIFVHFEELIILVVTNIKHIINKHFASIISLQRSHHLRLSLPTKVSKMSCFTLFSPTTGLQPYGTRIATTHMSLLTILINQRQRTMLMNRRSAMALVTKSF